MQKTTVYLPDDLKTALEHVAAETHRTESEIIREGLWLVLAQGRTLPPRSGILDSGDPSLSERSDELLAHGFGRVMRVDTGRLLATVSIPSYRDHPWLETHHPNIPASIERSWDAPLGPPGNDPADCRCA